jgi:hypothetical protein
MMFMAGFFSPGLSSPTQCSAVNEGLPKRIGTQAFRESNTIEEWQYMEFNKSFNGAIQLWIKLRLQKIRGNNKPFALLLKPGLLCKMTDIRCPYHALARIATA